MKQCENCKYFTPSNRPGEEHLGRCQRYAPRPGNTFMNDRACWPAVATHEKCGEFEPKSEE